MPLPEVRVPHIVPKAWGKEVWIANLEEYCGKLLIFNKGSKFSNHFHLLKKESWLVSKGKFLLTLTNLDNGSSVELTFNEGDAITIPRGQPHQLLALEDSCIVEVSTQHFDSDSYRIAPGDSQKK